VGRRGREIGHFGQLAGRVDRSAGIGAGFRHSGTTRTGPYDVDAAFMQFQVHESGMGVAFLE